MNKIIKRRIIIFGIDIFLVSLSLLITIEIFAEVVSSELFINNFLKLFIFNIFISSIVFNLLDNIKD